MSSSADERQPETAHASGSTSIKQHAPDITGSIDQPADIPVFTAHTDEEEEMMFVTAIRATNVVVGGGQPPTGFYVAVQHAGHEWRAARKELSANNNIEWDESIPIPSKPSARVYFGVYATFETDDNFRYAEAIHELVITVQQLQNLGSKDLSSHLPSKDAEDTSPSLSLFATVRQWTHESGDSMPTFMDPYCSIRESLDDLKRMANEGRSAFSRYRERRNILDLERSIQRFKYALVICPLHDPEQHTYLGHLAISLAARFERFHKKPDLDQAISMLEEAVKLTPDSHDRKIARLNNLAVCYRTQFTFFGEPGDLDQAIRRHQEAIRLAPDGQTSQLSQQENLDNPDHSSQLSDVELAISEYTEVVNLTPDGHPDKYRRMINLAHCHLIRFEHLGERGDLEKAIEMHTSAEKQKPSDKAAKTK